MISYDLFSICLLKYDLFVYLWLDFFIEMKNLLKICFVRIVWFCSLIVSGVYLVFGMYKFGVFLGLSFFNFSFM